MNQFFPIYQSGNRIGTLCASHFTNHILLECSLPSSDSARSHEVWLSDGQHRLFLGNTIPEGCVLRLHRRLSLQDFSLFPPNIPLRAELLPCSSPMPRFSDPLLQSRVCEALRTHHGHFQDGCLIFPYRPGEKFPLEPLFCFACVKEEGENTFLVFHIQNGIPVFPKERQYRKK